MSKFLFLVLAIASTKAFGCPNLSGSYSCSEVIDSKPTTYNMNIIQDASTMSWNDGKDSYGPMSLTGPTKFVVMKINAVTTPACTDSEVKMVSKAIIPFYGEKVIVTSTLTRTPTGLKLSTEQPFGTQLGECKKTK
jgi:hypothetical protein